MRHPGLAPQRLPSYLVFHETVVEIGLVRCPWATSACKSSRCHLAQGQEAMT